MIKIISHKEEFESLSRDWDYLWHKSKDATPFQKFDYIKLSVKYLLSEDSILHIIVVLNSGNGDIIAIFPTVLDSRGCLRFINDYHTDFCSAIINPDFQNYNLFKEVSEYIMSDTQIKTVDFSNIKSNNCILSVFKPFISTCLLTDCSYYSCLPVIPSSEDRDFLDALRYINGSKKKKHRKLIVNNAKSEFKIYRHDQGIEYPEEEIVKLTETMISKGLRTRDYFSKEMLKFWKEQYNCNILIAVILKTDGEVRSCNFIYYDEKHEEYIKWIMLYGESKWNLSVTLEIIKDIYNKGGGCINFARGIYDYKMDNFHPDVKVLCRLQMMKTEKDYVLITGGSMFNYYKKKTRLFIGRILREKLHIRTNY